MHTEIAIEIPCLVPHWIQINPIGAPTLFTYLFLLFLQQQQQHMHTAMAMIITPPRDPITIRRILKFTAINIYTKWNSMCVWKTMPSVATKSKKAFLKIKVKVKVTTLKSINRGEYIASIKSLFLTAQRKDRQTDIINTKVRMALQCSWSYWSLLVFLFSFTFTFLTRTHWWKCLEGV